MPEFGRFSARLRSFDGNINRCVDLRTPYRLENKRRIVRHCLVAKLPTATTASAFTVKMNDHQTMTPRALFREAINAMEVGFRQLEDGVQRPHVMKQGDGIALRYSEQTIHQALLLKLARYISGLNACDVLLANGYVQEQGVIQRTLDELDEDILFLCFGAQDGTVKLHRKYLKTFWQEEFEEGVAPIDNTKGRYHIPRREIREWLGQKLGTDADDPGMKAMRCIHQTYSGYVHAASPHIMDMCGGPELRFHLRGLNGTSRIPAHIHDLWNYVYRGLVSANQVALIFGDGKTATELRAALTKYEEASGSSYMDDAAKSQR